MSEVMLFDVTPLYWRNCTPARVGRLGGQWTGSGFCGIPTHPPTHESLAQRASSGRSPMQQDVNQEPGSDAAPTIIMSAKICSLCSRNKANDDTWRLLPNTSSATRNEPPRRPQRIHATRRLRPATLYECSNNNFNGNGNQFNGPVHLHIRGWKRLAAYRGKRSFLVRCRRFRAMARRLLLRQVKAVLCTRVSRPHVLEQEPGPFAI